MRLKVKQVYKLPVPVPNKTLLRQVISGGQIGADIAGLDAAKDAGFKTGGYMPTGFKTLAGNKPGYSWMYGLKDCGGGYKERTWKNVEEADATIRLALDFSTSGEVCTLNAIRHYDKPHLDIWMEPMWYDCQGDFELRLEPTEIAEWLVDNKVKVLNIAGNATPGLEAPVYFLLSEAFNLLLWG